MFRFLSLHFYILLAEKTTLWIWRHPATSDPNWLYLTLLLIRPHLTTSDNIWPHLTTSDNIWQHLTTSDNIWLHPTTSDNIWLKSTSDQAGTAPKPRQWLQRTRPGAGDIYHHDKTFANLVKNWSNDSLHVKVPDTITNWTVSGSCNVLG